MEHTRLSQKSQKLLSVLIEHGKPIKRDSLYFKAGLAVPTNGSNELAQRGNGIRSFCVLAVDGVVSENEALPIFGSSYISFVKVKEGFQLDLSKAEACPNFYEQFYSEARKNQAQSLINQLQKMVE